MKLSPLERRPEAVTDGPAFESLGLVHRVLRPAGVEPDLEFGTGSGRALDVETQAPPTVVMLHGMGGDERVMWIFAPTLPAHWLMISARGILPADHGAWTWRHRGPDEWPSLTDFGPAVTRLGRFVAGLPAVYGADPGRIILMGFSQGAALAFAAAIAWSGMGDESGRASGGQPGQTGSPSRPAALASLVGFLPPGAAAAEASRPLADLPVFMALGLRDALVPIDRARASVEQARRLGAEVLAREYEAGHKVPLLGMRDLGVWSAGLG